MEEFNTMLDNVYSKLNNNENTRLILPNLITVQSRTKLYWKNINNISIIINRDPEHIYNYLKSELTGKDINWISSNKNEGLVIQGKGLKENLLKDILKKYINKFVVCKSCNKINSNLTKNKDLGKYYFQCLDCGVNLYC